MSDKLDLKKHIRNVDDFPIPGIKFRDMENIKSSNCKLLVNSKKLFLNLYKQRLYFASTIELQTIL